MEEVSLQDVEAEVEATKDEVVLELALLLVAAHKSLELMVVSTRQPFRSADSICSGHAQEDLLALSHTL